METTLVPIFVCVVLPVAIVWIYYAEARSKDKRRADVLMRAIETRPDIDIAKLADALGAEPKKSPRQTLIRNLRQGCVFTLAAVAIFLFALLSVTDSDVFSASMLIGGLCLARGLACLIVCYLTRADLKQN